MIENIILETTFSVNKPGDGVPHRHVLHKEDSNIVYHRQQSDGSGWGRMEFHDELEKAIKHLLKTVREDRKSPEARDIKIILPSKPKDKRLCKDWADIGNYLSDAYDANIDVLSTSQQALITLMRQGGSWADRVYDAMWDVIDPLLKRITRPPAED
jgi:hypothetical protein